MANTELPPEVREKFRRWGRKGGKAGSREAKILAGRMGKKAQMASLLRKAREGADAEGAKVNGTPHHD